MVSMDDFDAKEDEVVQQRLLGWSIYLNEIRISIELLLCNSFLYSQVKSACLYIGED